MRRGDKNDSRIDYSTFSSFNNDGADSVLRNNVNTSAPYITQNQYNHLNKYQRSMSFDSVYKGPLESRNARQIKGRNQVDVRYQLKERIKGVGSRINVFKKETDKRSYQSYSKNQ